MKAACTDRTDMHDVVGRSVITHVVENQSGANGKIYALSSSTCSTSVPGKVHEVGLILRN